MCMPSSIRYAKPTGHWTQTSMAAAAIGIRPSRFPSCYHQHGPVLDAVPKRTSRQSLASWASRAALQRPLAAACFQGHALATYRSLEMPFYSILHSFATPKICCNSKACSFPRRRPWLPFREATPSRGLLLRFPAMPTRKAAAKLSRSVVRAYGPLAPIARTQGPSSRPVWEKRSARIRMRWTSVGGVKDEAEMCMISKA